MPLAAFRIRTEKLHYCLASTTKLILQWTLCRHRCHAWISKWVLDNRITDMDYEQTKKYQLYCSYV